MAYLERVDYDWSDPAQLDDWDVSFFGGTGQATVANGELLLAPAKNISGANILSKRSDFNAMEVTYYLSDNADSNLRYFDIGLGDSPITDDQGNSPGTDYWHQRVYSGVFANLQNAGAANGAFGRHVTNGVSSGNTNWMPPAAPTLKAPGNLMTIRTDLSLGFEVLVGSTLVLSEATTRKQGKAFIHQGWHSPTGGGAFARIQHITLYKGYDHLGGMEFKTAPITAVAANQEPRSQFQPQDVAWRGTPPMCAGPVNLQQQTQTPLCKGRDYFWIRDGVQNVLQGYIESTVTINGVGVRRRVLCFTQDGELVGETYSRASDGVYRFDLLWLNKRYMLVAQDDPAFGPADYNAVAADYQAPKPYPPGGGVAPAPFPMLAPLKRK